MMKISIVIPCYNSEASIKEVVELSIEELSKITGLDYEFVLVNDASGDNTWQEIMELAAKHYFVKGINLMRNFGQHNAIMCGLNNAGGDYVIGMDDDLQTHPSQMHYLINKVQEGFDVVYGVYEKSENSRMKRFSSWLNRTTSRVLIGKPKGINSSNYWIISKRVRDEVIKNKNYNPYVDAIFFRTTKNISNISISHHKREYGSSNYTFSKLLKLWMAYFNYSVIPLRIASFTGVLMSVISVIAGIVVVISKLINPPVTIGWASLICLMMFFFGLVLLVLGVIGEYIGDIVLNINGMPQYIEKDRINTD